MNEELLKYFKESTPEEIRVLVDSISRGAKPKAKAFWDKLYSMKKSKVNDNSLYERLLSEALAHDPKDIFVESSGIPKKVLDEVHTKEKPIEKAIETPVDEVVKKDIFPDSFSSKTDDNYPNYVYKRGQTYSPTAKKEVDSAQKQAKKQTKSEGKKINRTDEKPIDSVSRPEMESLIGNLEGLGLSPISESFSNWEDVKAVNLANYEDSVSSETLQNRERVKGFLDTFKDTLGPLVDTIDMISANREEKEAMRIADRAERQSPKSPAVRGENRILSNLIRNSQIANSNPGQMIQPYMDQINLGYNDDLRRSEELSGGQMGNALAMSQAAAIRRNNANLGVAPMLSEIYNQGLNTTGALVGQQMQDDTWRDQQNIDIYKTNLADNRDLQRQAGLGLASSRARKLQARNNMLDGLLDSPAFDVDTYMNYTRNNLIDKPII